MSCCYLICFERPYKHARHYLGFTKDDTPDRRIDSHRRGTGARLMSVVNAAGIKWTHVRTWKGATRQDEIKLKKRGGAARHCPVCKAVQRAARELAGKVLPIPGILVDTTGAAG